MNNTHGDDLFRYDNIRHNFSSNIFGHADLSGLESLLASHLSRAIGAYPEPDPESVETLVAQQENIPVDNVIVTSGATSLIYMIAEMMRGKTYIVHHPAFAEYENACRLHDMQRAYQGDKPRLEWICNPNNPDGSVWAKDKLLRHIDLHPDTLFIIDASYEDYTLAPLPDTHGLLERKNVITLHSMTKRYCIPGLRLGYAIALPHHIDRLKKLRQPWSVNSIAIEAARYLLTNNVNVLPPINEYLEEKNKLSEAISRIDGFDVFPSETTFFLCTSGLDASVLKETLAKDYGILIRDASNFHSLTRNHFRIATQNREDNEALIQALSEIATK